MFLFFLRISTWIVEWWSALVDAYTRCRRKWIHPVIFRDGYDMTLLRNNSWIHGSVSIPDQLKVAKYVASSSQIIGIEGEPLKRWHWLSVVAGEEDVSDFFNRIRISHSLAMTSEQMLLLYAHQTGKVLKGVIDIVLRNGDEQKINGDSLGSPTPPTVPKPETPRPSISNLNDLNTGDSSKELNYIR
jgi:hypothetical protein